MKARDAIERIFWTVMATTLGGFTVTGLIGDTEWTTTLLIVGVTGVYNFVTLIARWRLSVLPNPGGGLPGIPVDQG